MRLGRICASIFAVLCAGEVSYAQSALNLAEGTWELIPGHELSSAELEANLKCGVNPLSVRIDPEAKRYYFTFDSAEAELGADILRAEDRFISIQYDNETRLMSNGKPHIWFMYFKNDDEFTWIRQDWLSRGGGTPARRRCKPELG